MSEVYHTTVVVGHAASGKSLWAEQEVGRIGGRALYIATARIWDDEMRTKVAEHAARRGSDWTVIEAPLDLASACAARDADETVLIDCATLWLTNLMMDKADWQAAANEWFSAMAASPATFVVVTNDVGGGVVPENAMARQFQRMQGQLNQNLAAQADRVVQVTAGLPLRLK